jgi:hypothetical protein
MELETSEQLFSDNNECQVRGALTTPFMTHSGNMSAGI